MARPRTCSNVGWLKLAQTLASPSGPSSSMDGSSCSNRSTSSSRSRLVSFSSFSTYLWLNVLIAAWRGRIVWSEHLVCGRVLLLGRPARPLVGYPHAHVGWRELTHNGWLTVDGERLLEAQDGVQVVSDSLGA